MGYILERVCFLPFNLHFIVTLTFAITIVYVSSTYVTVFEHFEGATYISLVTLILFGIDIVAGCMHKSNPVLANKREHKPRPSLQIFIEIVTFILSLISLTGTNTVTLMIVVNVLRLWKIVYCYIATSNLVGHVSIISLLAKFFIASLIIVHTFSVAWYQLMIYETERGLDSWESMVINSKVISEDIWDWYILCVYFVTNTYTTEGTGDICGKTDLEKWLSLVIMICGYIVVTGLFIAAFTTNLTLKYQYYADYKQRRSLIHKVLETDYFPTKNTADSIKIFYDRFWQEEEGIQRAELMQKLPTPIQEMVLYDIYKDALNSCCLLSDLPTAVKRTLSHYTSKQAYLPGWKIVEKEAWTDTYIYIAYGVAQVLTDEDDESSVFAIGLGSCISSSALILSRPSKVHVNSATYCITHQLKRSHLFGVLKHYQGSSKLVINKYRTMLAEANSRFEIQKNSEYSIFNCILLNLFLSISYCMLTVFFYNET